MKHSATCAYVRHCPLALQRKPQNRCIDQRRFIPSHGGAPSRTPLRPPASILESAISMVPLEALAAPHPGIAVGFGAATAVFVLGLPVLLSGLTPAGVVTSWILGSMVFAAFGRGGFALVCAYFLLGSAVTKFKLKEKTEKGIAESRGGKRGPNSAIGSGFAGLVCAAVALSTSQFGIMQTAFVASFGSKLSDTVSSEVGKGFGKTTFLITTLQRVPPGTEGAVSLEGTLAGIAAAAVYAALAILVGQVELQGAAICTLASTVANVAESYIGATSQGSVEWLTNDVVNVIQICIAAAIAALLAFRLKGAWY